MSDTDQKQEDDVLRRMLATPPTPHKHKGNAKPRVTYVKDTPKKRT